jgi:hypothetical protein
VSDPRLDPVHVSGSSAASLSASSRASMSVESWRSVSIGSQSEASPSTKSPPVTAPSASAQVPPSMPAAPPPKPVTNAALEQAMKELDLDYQRALAKLQAEFAEKRAALVKSHS